jgi:hypothetical protein
MKQHNSRYPRLNRAEQKQVAGGGIGVWILPCYAVYHKCKTADGNTYQAKTECCEKDSTQCKLTCHAGDTPA